MPPDDFASIHPPRRPGWQRLPAWLSAARRWLGWGGAVAAPGLPQGAGQQAGWAWAWASQPSPHHANQDCAHVTPWGRGGLALALADGVSNGAHGEVAARTLVGHWLAAPGPASSLMPHLVAAESAVAGALARLGPQAGAATGAAAWLQADGHGWITRVGDCRALRAQPAAWGGWHLEALLPDQTFGLLFPDLYGPGAQSMPAHVSASADQPARMVGCGSLGEPELLPLTLAPGELFLLLSDGVHGVLSMAQLAQALAATAPGPAATSPLGVLAQRLVQHAVQAGSEDDITALLLMRSTDASPVPTAGPVVLNLPVSCRDQEPTP